MSLASERFRAHSHKLVVVRALAAVGLVCLALAAWLTLHSTSCKLQEGTFSSDFSSDFDVSFTECRSSALKGIVIEVDEAFPYLTLRRE
jgi:hypothetical protein